MKDHRRLQEDKSQQQKFTSVEEPQLLAMFCHKLFFFFNSIIINLSIFLCGEEMMAANYFKYWLVSSALKPIFTYCLESSDPHLLYTSQSPILCSKERRLIRLEGFQCAGMQK